MMNPGTDKLVRRTAMVATVTASYFLLTADYGPEPNVLDPAGGNAIEAVRILLLYRYLYTGICWENPSAPCLQLIKKAILSAEDRMREFVLGPSSKPQENQMGSMGSNNSKEQPKT